MLATPQTVLTVLRPDQAELLHAYEVRNREHLAPWEPLREESYYTLDDARERITQTVKHFEARKALHLVALDRTGGDVVAVCNFLNFVFGPFQACHLGFSVDHRREGANLMFEVAQAAISHVFDAYELHRIMANRMVENRRCERLLDRLGFVEEGRALSYLQIAGRWEDHVLTSLLNPAHMTGDRA